MTELFEETFWTVYWYLLGSRYMHTQGFEDEPAAIDFFDSLVRGDCEQARGGVVTGASLKVETTKWIRNYDRPKPWKLKV